jgi:anti-anti-sigma factor
VQITQSTKDGIAILRPAGNLDSTTAPALQSAVSAVVAEKWFAIDLAGIGFVASAGLRVILSVAKQANARGGALAIFGLSTPVRETFDIAGLGPLIAIAVNEADAVLLADLPASGV